MLTVKGTSRLNCDLGTEKFVKVPIPGGDTIVQVYMEVGPLEKDVNVFVASLDLGRLGEWVKARRKRWRLQDLYVFGQMPESLELLDKWLAYLLW
jgi:hypothetical protein